MTEIIEPNPLLIEYIQTSNSLWTEFDGGNEDEWHYIMSNIEQNIFLLKRMQEIGLLEKDSYHIVDAGIGLGSALFDFYLQSKDFPEKKFTFTGIEKYDRYIDFFNSNLKSMWNDEIEIIKSDVMEHNYSNYDIVYIYSPFRGPRRLLELYNKISSEIRPGSIIIENRNRGRGIEDCLTIADGLEMIKIDDIVVFRKI